MCWLKQSEGKIKKNPEHLSHEFCPVQRRAPAEKISLCGSAGLNIEQVLIYIHTYWIQMAYSGIYTVYGPHIRTYWIQMAYSGIYTVYCPHIHTYWIQMAYSGIYTVY